MSWQKLMLRIGFDEEASCRYFFARAVEQTDRHIGEYGLRRKMPMRDGVANGPRPPGGLAFDPQLAAPRSICHAGLLPGALLIVTASHARLRPSAFRRKSVAADLCHRRSGNCSMPRPAIIGMGKDLT
jgi:hypothetical protein